MDEKTVDQPISALHSTRLDIRYIEKERKRLTLIQFPFYSGKLSPHSALGYFVKSSVRAKA